MIASLRRYAAFRWLCYAVLLPMMAAAALRREFDVWLAMAQQHEAGWRRRAQQEDAARRAFDRIANDAREFAIANSNAPLKFRRYAPFVPTAATHIDA